MELMGVGVADGVVEPDEGESRCDDGDAYYECFDKNVAGLAGGSGICFCFVVGVVGAGYEDYPVDHADHWSPWYAEFEK